MIVQQLILLFGLILSGYIINRCGILDATSNERISKFLVNISIPATIIHSAAVQKMESGGKVIIIFVIAVLYFILMPLISMLVAKLLKAPPTFQLMLTYSNLGFMGIPIISSIYGEDAVFYVTVFMMVFNISIFSQGIWILNSGKSDEKKGFDIKDMINPGVLCAVIALIIFLFRIPVQSDLDQLLSSIGSVTTPLAMIIIGSSLAEIPLKAVFLDKTMYILAILKLFVYPLIVFVILRIFIKDSMIIGISVLLTSLPTAGNVSMVCSEYGGELGLVSKGICISTLLSIIAIPIWIGLVG